MALTDAEKKALAHIRRQGDDRNLLAKRWWPVKRSLARKGFLTRRIGDWAWVPTTGQSAVPETPGHRTDHARDDLAAEIKRDDQ